MKTPVTRRRSRRLGCFARTDEAVSALEYAILVGVIAVAVGAALVTFGGQIGTSLGNIGTDINKIKIQGTGSLN